MNEQQDPLWWLTSLSEKGVIDQPIMDGIITTYGENVPEWVVPGMTYTAFMLTPLNPTRMDSLNLLVPPNED